METNTHKFIFIEEGVYLIQCLTTHGEFSTVSWNNEKIKQNFCPCCKEFM